MSNTPDTQAIDHFLHGQVDAWNAHDKDTFFALYKEFSPEGLSIEYVGRPAGDPWQTLEAMWTNQNAKIRIDVKATIINGHEVACHHVNQVIGSEHGIHTIELYRFEGGKLFVRYFVKA